jgi:tetratricopeptide (TPR) repeat protein
METCVARAMRSYLTAGCLAAALTFTWAVSASGADEEKLAATQEAPDRLSGDDAAGHSLLGSYLAGRLAMRLRDNASAATFFREALDKDPGNRTLLEEAFQLAVATANREEAKRLAQLLVAEKNGNSAAHLFLGVESTYEGHYSQAEKYFKASGKGPIADRSSALARAWVLAGKRRVGDAIKLIRGLPQGDWSQNFQQYHLALISDFGKRQKTSRAVYAALFKKNLHDPRLAEAYARHAIFWQDRPLAEKILAPFVTRAIPHPQAKALMAEISTGGQPRLLVATPQDGVAEVFFGIGEALTAENGGTDLALRYLQLALFAKPSFATARYTLGELYGAMKNYPASIAELDRIPPESPLWFNAQIQKAVNLQGWAEADPAHKTERSAEAVVELQRLLEKEPQNLAILQLLGAIERGAKKYGEAADYYSRAIASVAAPDKRHWALYYNRGICHERMKQWPQAEADFKKAIALNGEQPAVLNYLGYSWIDQNSHVKEGMALIKKAVQLKPNDGYFVDSLGWAYYRIRNYKRAVGYLQRAVEIQPQDATINGHLGDAFWRVGRVREAQFQWSLALSFKPEPEEAAVLKRKLTHAKNGNGLAVTFVLNQDTSSNATRSKRAFVRALTKNIEQR